MHVFIFYFPGIDILKEEAQHLTTPLTNIARDQVRSRLIRLKARILFEVNKQVSHFVGGQLKQMADLEFLLGV